MVRSKRKWKKDSPEKLASRIERSLEKSKEVRLSKEKIKSPEITSPETKKSKSTELSPTESSSGDILNTCLIISESQSSILEESPDSMEVINPTVPGRIINEVGNPETLSQKSSEHGIDEEEKLSSPPEPEPKIENTLKMITDSLATLTRNVLIINNNMVSKSDLAEMKNSVESHEKLIAENSKMLVTKMSKEDGLVLQKKLKDHDSILQTNAGDLERLSASIKSISDKQETISQDKTNTSNRIDGLAAAQAKTTIDLQKEIEDLKARMSNQSAEITSLKNGQRVVNVPQGNQNTNDVPQAFPSQPQSPRLNIIIEGLEEKEGEDLLLKALTLFEQLGVKLLPTDILTTSRLRRRIPLGKRPNPVKVTFVSLSAKERVMSVKYNLNARPETQKIWINHDEPTELRRAKGRARTIASYSRKKGSDVQVTQRGIILDSVFYGYDNLDRIPSIYIPPKTLSIPQATTTTNNQAAEPMEMYTQNQLTRDAHGGAGPPPRTPTRAAPIAPDHTVHEGLAKSQRGNQSQSPKVPRIKMSQKMRLTASGLVYSGPTAILSHLYKARFVIDNIPYNSVEQRLQSQKAVLAKDRQAEDDIMNLHNTWDIKTRGDRVKVTKEYIDNRLVIAGVANEAKYQQNDDLMEFLLETEDLVLVEGATSAFWAGGEPFNSLAYDNGDVHGKNNQGLLVMNTRENERNRRTAPVI